MEWLQTVTLAVIQGITEFLPISSSAHLALIPFVTGWPDQGQVMDIALHTGTLLALLIYFRSTCWQLAIAPFKAIKQRPLTEDTHAKNRLLLGLIIATLPLIVITLLWHHTFSHFRSPIVIMLTTALFGLALGAADWRSQNTMNAKSTIHFTDALLIGLMQVLAIIPGVSRSGITLTTALWLGIERKVATEFAFLLAVPVISGASLFALYQATDNEFSANIHWPSVALGSAIAFVVALLTIHWFLKVIRTISLKWFVYYRLVLAVTLGWFCYDKGLLHSLTSIN